MFRRFSIVLSSTAAASGLLLLWSEVAQQDQAALFASIALFAVAFSIYILGVLPAPFYATDVWDSIRWGRLFVAMVYASIAVLCFAAMLHAPDFGQLMHTFHVV